VGLQSEGCVVALRVSDGGGEHELLRNMVLAITSGLLVRSAPVLKKVRVARGGEWLSFQGSYPGWHARPSLSNVDFEPWHCTNFHFPANSSVGSDCASFRSFAGIPHCLLMICCIVSICRSTLILLMNIVSLLSFRD